MACDHGKIEQAKLWKTSPIGQDTFICVSYNMRPSQMYHAAPELSPISGESSHSIAGTNNSQLKQFYQASIFVT